MTIEVGFLGKQCKTAISPEITPIWNSNISITLTKRPRPRSVLIRSFLNSGIHVFKLALALPSYSDANVFQMNLILKSELKECVERKAPGIVAFFKTLFFEHMQSISPGNGCSFRVTFYEILGRNGFPLCKKLVYIQKGRPCASLRLNVLLAVTGEKPKLKRSRKQRTVFILMHQMSL